MGKFNLENLQKAVKKVEETGNKERMQNVGRVDNIPAEYIHFAKNNIYNEQDTEESIKEMANSIEGFGLLTPLTVRKISDGNYELISGERRYRALTEHLNRRLIPCIVFENLSDDEALAKLSIANLDVRKYTSSQLYRYYLQLKDVLTNLKSSGKYHGSVQQAIAERLDISVRQVKKLSAVEKLPDDMQKQIIDGTLSVNQALELYKKQQNPTEPEQSEQEKTEQQQNPELDKLSALLNKLTDEQKAKIFSDDFDFATVMEKSESKESEPIAQSEQTEQTEIPEKESVDESKPSEETSPSSTDFDFGVEVGTDMPDVTDISTGNICETHNASEQSEQQKDNTTEEKKSVGNKKEQETKQSKKDTTISLQEGSEFFFNGIRHSVSTIYTKDREDGTTKFTIFAAKI